ncbi:TOBE domain-containing protein, partial [Diaphorobacter nitroreducens]|uniref:TOBE domain-containing protein n=1 Tax=Diaphorobacter nitroreducens TaxID=164759 RepID=UPI0028AAA590
RTPESQARGVLTLGGMTLTCPPALSQSALLVRPEDIQIGPRQDGWGMARVEQRSFLGDRGQLRLSAAGIASTLLADVGRDAPYRNGDEVGIHIDPQRLMSTAEASA